MGAARPAAVEAQKKMIITTTEVCPACRGEMVVKHGYVNLLGQDMHIENCKCGKSYLVVRNCSSCKQAEELRIANKKSRE